MGSVIVRAIPSEVRDGAHGHAPHPNAMDDRRLLRVAGLALPAAVWILGLVAPRQGGLTPGFVLAYTGLLAGLTLVDLTAPQSAAAPLWRRLVWLGAELALCFWVVQVHGTLI